MEKSHEHLPWLWVNPREPTNQPILDEWPTAKWFLHVQGFESFQSSVTGENCPSGCNKLCLDFQWKKTCPIGKWKLELCLQYVCYYMHIINHWVYINHVLLLISQHLSLETKIKTGKLTRNLKKKLKTIITIHHGLVASPWILPRHNMSVPKSNSMYVVCRIIWLQNLIEMSHFHWNAGCLMTGSFMSWFIK